MSTPRLGTGRRLELLSLALGALLLLLFQLLLFRYGPVVSAGAIGLLILFVSTFLYLEVGIAALIAAMLLSPEVAIGDVSVRMLTIRLEDVLIPTVLLAWLARAASEGRERLLRLPVVLLPLGIYSALALISTLRGASAGRLHLAAGLLYIAKQLEFYGIFLLTVQYVRDLKRLRIVVVGALATCLALALYNFHKLPSTQIWTSNRISAPFEGGSPEPSSIGGYFALMMALIVALLLHAPRGQRRWLWLSLAVVLPPFLLTLSRSSYVALLVVLGLLVVITRHRKLMAILAGGLLLSPLLLPSRVIERIAYTFNDRIKVFGLFDRSLGERIFIWYKVSWSMRQRPLLGSGVTYHDIIDSSYARLLVETGLLGTLAYVTALLLLLRIGWRLYARSGLWWLKGLGLGYTVGSIGLMFHAFAAVTFNIVRIMEPFWLVSGVIVSADLLVRSGELDSEGGDRPDE